MGQVKLLKCKQCGNVWEHWEGVGFASEPIKGEAGENRTGDADEKICCPQCGSEDYEWEDQTVVALWD